jgi:hypothetical protein
LFFHIKYEKQPANEQIYLYYIIINY